jgi:hypothetical protein
LPDVWRKRGWLKNNGVARIENGRPHDTGGCLFIAGSCSPATRKQNAYLAAQGAHVFQLDPQALATGELNAESIASRVIEELVAGRDCLLTTSSSPAEVQAMQTWGAAPGLDAVAVGEAILRTLSAITLRIVVARIEVAACGAGGGGVEPAGGFPYIGNAVAILICRRLCRAVGRESAVGPIVRRAGDEARAVAHRAHDVEQCRRKKPASQ